MEEIIGNTMIQGGALAMLGVVVYWLMKQVDNSRADMKEIAKDSYLTNQRLAAAVERLVDETCHEREKSETAHKRNDDAHAKILLGLAKGGIE